MRQPILLSRKLISSLQAAGINTLHPPDRARFPYDTLLEPPCSLKWARAEYSFAMGAFSYAVSGYFFACEIGRYCSIGEQVQVGRHSHPLDFASTSPIFYLQSLDVLGVESHPTLCRSPLSSTRPPTHLKKTIIGNDVYIGHGAFIMPGVTIGNGAVIGACSVVTKNIPPFAIAAGVPAEIKRYRFEPETIVELLNAEWWDYTPIDFVGLDPANPHQFIQRANDLREAGAPSHKPRKIELAHL